MPRRMSYDKVLFLTAGFLMLGGLLMVGSTSSFASMKLDLPADHYMVRQSVWMCAGLVAMLVMMNVPYERLANGRLVGVSLLLSIVALVGVFLMPPVNGAHRWLFFGPLGIQPSEFVKYVAILFTAWVLSRKQDEVNDFWAVPIPLAIILGPIVVLIYIEPDLGSTVMLMAVISLMVFVAGLRWRYVFAFASVGAMALVASVLYAPYRLERVLAFLRADDNILSVQYQLRQSLVALGHGGAFGLGLGGGHQKAYFLPEAHTDFVYAVIGEEFGLIGTVVVLVAFLVLFWRGMRAALGAPDRFGFYLALGITSLIVVQALVNMSVCVGLFPTKGLALPFLSYGGSSLLATLAATGVLLNVSQHSN